MRSTTSTRPVNMMIPTREFSRSQRQSVLAGQHQIEDDQIDRRLRHKPPHFRAVMCDRDSVILA